MATINQISSADRFWSLTVCEAFLQLIQFKGAERVSHLIGCINVDAIFDVVQSLVQVTRTGRPQETVPSIRLQTRKKAREKDGGGGVEESERDTPEWGRNGEV